MFFCKEILWVHSENARADKDRFSDKPTLSARADNVGVSQINQAFF